MPRWKCKKCRRTFRQRRKDLRDRSALSGYVLDRSTYRRLAVRWRVSPSTAYERVKRALTHKQALIERTKRHLHGCDGVLVLDGKWLRIQGRLWTLFVAWDRGFQKPIHFLIREGGERDIPYWRLLVDLKHIGYVPKAFISDGTSALRDLLEDMYPKLPHQRCTVHVFLAARSKVSRRKRQASLSERQKDFIGLLKQILWSRTLKEAKRRCEKLSRLPSLTRNERLVLEFIWPTLPQCFVCRDEKWRDLKLPRSSNSIENVIGQIEARLKTQRGIKSETSIQLLTNELLFQVTNQVINQ